ncbi:PREDICTED: myosin regulatory light chain 2, ventricular/cardiac muscle isoform-like [Hipposideros armiger]|uniref:Myosin regulatory light chain 2, ventricular/cardiac muscle isoform-like n=1 Tax=Hipposideros armiger TaxID=186990 RepID=A0A8B7RZC3_HIPAR|nr:PREDICTED: myosin regulatory light chain 2, ventricular/cardiac muscle isoform-like [Hipposideros armiger]
MAPKKAKKRAEGANSNVFSMFEQTQIQEFKEAFTIMDQNRDGFIDKNDLRDTFAALGMSPPLGLREGLLIPCPRGAGGGTTKKVKSSFFRETNSSTTMGL